MVARVQRLNSTGENMGIKGTKARKKLDVRVKRFNAVPNNVPGMKFHKPGSLNSNKG